MNQEILGYVYMFVYVVLLIFIFLQIKKTGDKLKKNYYKEEYNYKSKSGDLNFYQHMAALITPHSYLKEKNFGEGYRLFLFYTLMYIALGIIAVLLLKEIGFPS